MNEVLSITEIEAKFDSEWSSSHLELSCGGSVHWARNVKISGTWSHLAA